MNKLLFFLLLFLSLSAYSHQSRHCISFFGKVKIDCNCWLFDDQQPSNEFGFRNLCIAMITNCYLMETLTEKEYQALPKIELHLYQKSSDFKEFEISLTDSTLNIWITSDNQLATNTLKMVDHALKNLKKYKAYLSMYKTFDRLFVKKENRDAFPQIEIRIDSASTQNIIHSTLNESMRTCLNQTYYRGKNKQILFDNLDRYNTLYSFRNDSFFIQCDGDELQYLQQVERIIYSQQLGYFIFDTENSFFYHNPSDIYKAKAQFEEIERDPYYKLKNNHYMFRSPRIQEAGACADLSKRHKLDIKILSRIEIEEEDVINNRILLVYTDDYSDRSNFLVKFYPRIKVKRKFMYLIDEDILIPDYQRLEQEAINKHKSLLQN